MAFPTSIARMMNAKQNVRRGRMSSRRREKVFTALPAPRGGWTTPESGYRHQLLLQGFSSRRCLLFTGENGPHLADVRLGHVFVLKSCDDGRPRHYLRGGVLR